MQIRRIQSISELHDLRTAWNCLAANPFRTWEWLVSWAENYLEPEHDLYVLAAETQGELVGLLPLYRDQSTQHGRRLQWLGSGEVCTDHLGILATEEFQPEVCSAMADWLASFANDTDDGWDVLQLDAVDGDEPTVHQLADSLQQVDCTVHKNAAVDYWKIEATGDWTEYLSTLSKSNRKKMKRLERNFVDHPDTQLHQATEQNFDEGMKILVDLHQKRRNELGEPGCFASANFARFLNSAARRLLTTNQTNLCWLTSGDRPIAVECQFTAGDTAYAYQAGIDPTALEMEPGRAIFIATFRKCIAEGMPKLDLLRGNEPYKANWRADPHETVNWRVVAPKALSRVRHGIWLAGATVKNWIKTNFLAAETQS